MFNPVASKIAPKNEPTRLEIISLGVLKATWNIFSLSKSKRKASNLRRSRKRSPLVNELMVPKNPPREPKMIKPISAE